MCWEKFARYFEVELRDVKLRDDYYVMDPVKAVELCDENTICVCAILGSTYNGEFEDVKTLNDLLIKKNAEKGYVVTQIFADFDFTFNQLFLSIVSAVLASTNQCNT